MTRKDTRQDDTGYARIKHAIISSLSSFHSGGSEDDGLSGRKEIT